MRPIRFGIIALCCLLAITAAFTGTMETVIAVDAGSCKTLLDSVNSAARAACDAASINTACYAYDGVSAKSSGGDTPTFKAKGDTLDLTKLISLTTSPADAVKNEMGVAILKIQADLPDDSKGITAVLFGDATLNSDVQADSANMTTFPVKTIDADPVLLRTAASSNNPAAGRLLSGKDAVVDGRTNDSKWLRVRTKDVLGWALATQVNVKGDVSTLKILDAQDTIPFFNYTETLQAFSISSSDAANPNCADAKSGLLLQSSDKQAAHLLINGTEVSFAAATLLVRAAPKNMFDVNVIGGTASVKSQGTEVMLNVGESIQVKLGGQNGLLAVSIPRSKGSLGFDKLDNIPAATLPNSLSCLVGITAKDKAVAARSGPGTKEYTSLFYLKADQIYSASGFAPASDGSIWWKIASASNNAGWVDKSVIRSLGTCDVLAKIDPGAVVVANPGKGTGSTGNPGDNSTPGAPAAVDLGFAPSAKTIYNVVPTPDHMEGSCSGPLNYCPLLVAITPQQNGVLYKGQELKIYFLARVKQNVYGYVGRNGLNDSKLILTVVFTGASTFNATEVVIPDAEPTCKHNYNFNGTAR